MVIGHLVLLLPFGHLILPVILDITMQHFTLTTFQVQTQRRTTSFLTPLLEVVVPVVRPRKLFQYQEPCKSFSSGKTSLEDSLSQKLVRTFHPSRPRDSILTGSIFDLSRAGQKTSNPRCEYLESRFSYDGDLRVRSIRFT